MSYFSPVDTEPVENSPKRARVCQSQWSAAASSLRKRQLGFSFAARAAFAMPFGAAAACMALSMLLASRTADLWTIIYDLACSHHHLE